MSKGLDIELFGFEELKGRLDNLSNRMTSDIDKSMGSTVADINKLQKSYTPVDNGVLRQGNRFRKNKEMDFTIYNNINYSPYVEFGTGGLVSIPPGLEDIAVQFKGKGIKKVNLPAQPFFFRAFFEKRKAMVENIKTTLFK